jgi:predicted amidohydrolase
VFPELMTLELLSAFPRMAGSRAPRPAQPGQLHGPLPRPVRALVAQGAQILVCPSYTTSDAGVWRIRHCAQARCVENQVYAVVSCLGGSNGPPVETGVARSAIFAPCDAGWPADGVLADARLGDEAIVRARLDLEALEVTRREGTVRTYADRRRRASLYAGWSAHAGAGT